METLVESIKRHEGYREDPYLCSQGFWTVGWGHNIHNMASWSNGEDPVWPDIVCDVEQHETWLQQDIATARRAAMEWLGPVMDSLSLPQQHVVIEMAFQLGARGQTKFVKMKQALVDGDIPRAADEMLDSLWHQQTPERVEELSDKLLEG